jgi:hypothetical protein
MAADPHIRGYYLSADVAHDFGNEVLQKSSYNYGGPAANTKLTGTPKIEEDAAVEFIEVDAKNKNGTEFVENGEARRSKRIIFTIPAKTATFSASSVPTLFEGGNNAIGIIQDAGSFITGFLGAKNVITFGSILDPAGKPISKDDAPIWYQPPSNTQVSIPLGPFGFDTTKIQEITVSGMTAGLVSSTFTLGDGKTVYDAVTMKPYNNPAIPLGRKPINNTKIESSGFYTSIAKAEGATKGKTSVPGYLFNVGKTLGDAALVASAMPSFRSNDERQLLPNPLYGVGTPTARDRDSPGWHDWISGEPVQGPSILMLKTGDRLNALRAQMENVPNILEQQAGKGRIVKQYLFTPGKADPGAILAAVNQGYINLKENVAGRYDALIQNFKALLIGDSLNPKYTIFTETPTIKDSEGLALAGKLIQLMNRCLTGVKNGILKWITDRSQYNPKDIEIFQTNYNSDVETCTRVAPQTTEVTYTKGVVTKIVLKIIVSQVPKVLPEGYTCPLKVSLDISLWNAFLKLQRNGGGKGLPAILGTDVYNRFFIPVESLFGKPLDELKQRGGGVGNSLPQWQAPEPEEEEEEEDEEEEVEKEDEVEVEVEVEVEAKTRAPVEKDPEERKLLTEFVNYVSPSPKEGGMSGGYKYVKVHDKQLWRRYTEDTFEIEFPLIYLFHIYLHQKLGLGTKYQGKIIPDYKKTFAVIYDLKLNRGGQNPIADDTFLNEFMKEVDYLTIEKEELKREETNDRHVLVIFSGGKSASERKGKATGGTAAFNAFTYYINQHNANTFGFIDPLEEKPDESTTVKYELGTMPSFKELEELFLDKAKLWLTPLRSGTSNFYVSQAGRRPLYRRRKTYRRKPRSNKTRKQ